MWDCPRSNHEALSWKLQFVFVSSDNHHERKFLSWHCASPDRNFHLNRLQTTHQQHTTFQQDAEYLSTEQWLHFNLILTRFKIQLTIVDQFNWVQLVCPNSILNQVGWIGLIHSLQLGCTFLVGFAQIPY